jgi:uncharacterized protein
MFCHICKKPTNLDFEPFCSKTCKNIDLLRWLNEDYRIPTQEPITDEDAIEDEDAQ